MTILNRRALIHAILIAAASLRPMTPQSNFEGQPKLDSILAAAKKGDWKKLPIGDLTAKVAEQFIGTPFVSWSLERDPDKEFCYVTLDGLDCVTFFESSLAIARMIQKGESTADDLIKEVTLTRYRQGVIAGFPSRLHYSADWIADNARKGSVTNLSMSLPGSIPLRKDIHFMSSKPHLYRQLKAHPELIREIETAEHRLTKEACGPSPILGYVPKQGIAKIENELKTGDIVGIVTSINGMDCSHTGLIVREGKTARFLHASSISNKVVLGPRISEYLSKNEKSLGLMVARPR